MGLSRGFKSFVTSVNMGFKHVVSAAKIGHKFIQDNVKSIANDDALARKAANTMHSVGEYAEMGVSIGGWTRR